MNIYRACVGLGVFIAILGIVIRFYLRPDFPRALPLNAPSPIIAAATPATSPTYKDPDSISFELKEKDLAAVSPYDIARFARRHSQDYVSFKNLWNALGIELEDGRVYAHCEVQNFRVSFDEEPGRELLQRLYDKMSGWSSGGTRYLLWKRGNGGRWKLLGYLDREGQRYTEPAHRIFKIGVRHFLTVDYMTAHGGGGGCNSESWYELQEGSKELKEVLTYPSWSWGMAYAPTPEEEIRSNVAGTRIVAGKASVIVNFTTKYTLREVNDRVQRRWQKRERATFIWSKKEGQFTFQRRGSTITKKQLEALGSC